MKIEPISLMLLVVVLVCGAAPQASAFQFVTPRIVIQEPDYDFTFCIGRQQFGFVQEDDLLENREDVTTLYAGPFGSREVPFAAKQCLIGFGFVLVMLVVLPAVCWRTKRGEPEQNQ